MTTYFWFAAGTLTGLALSFVLLPLRRVLIASVQSPVKRYSIATLAIVAFGAAVMLIYRSLGQPDALDSQPTTASLPHPGAVTPAAGDAMNSVESAAAGLEERTTRDGGTRSDWLLLAQSYDFLGRPEDAARARARADDAPASTSSTRTTGANEREVALGDYQRRVREDPRDAVAWLSLANLYRQQRDFASARDAFAKLIELKAMSADSWADYADVLGSLSGSLAGEPARAIDRALALDAKHSKALWLKASLAHQQQRYSDALALWKKLRALLPPDSPDTRIIDSNIAEATQLAQQPATDSGGASQSMTVKVTGTVSIDQKLAGRVAPGATLFIYAKAADSPGPPLAVLRTSTGTWPVSFRLDDTLAMIPERRLSSFDRVVVEARISRTGQATPTPGDLFVVSPVLRPADGKSLQLVISREVS